MALLSDLVRTIATVEGLDETSVSIFARTAREAGYLSQGGRGKSAAKMKVQDAANLLIAVNGCSLAKEILNSLPTYRILVASNTTNLDQIPFKGLGSSFGDDLERLISLWSSNNGLKVNSKSGASAKISFNKSRMEVDIELHSGTSPESNSVLHYRHPNRKSESSHHYSDRSDVTIITDRTIAAVSELLSQP